MLISYGHASITCSKQFLSENINFHTCIVNAISNNATLYIPYLHDRVMVKLYVKASV